jgi:hypothetical protein
VRRHEERLWIQFQQLFSAVEIDPDNDKLLVVGDPAGPASIIVCQVGDHFSGNPNHLSTAVRFFLTTGAGFAKEITDGGP